MIEKSEHPLSDAKIYLTKYRVEQLVFMLGETNLSMDHTNIISVEYCADYDFNIRAILKISLRIDGRQKLWLLRNKRNITCKFQFVKFGMDAEVNESVTTSEYVWNQDFKIYFSDADEAIDTNSMEQRLDINEGSSYASTDINNENYYESQNLLDVFLFDQELLNASNMIFNEIFTSNLLQTCVGRLLTATNHNKVLMSPFENDEIYNELLVPAFPAWKSLIYLDQYYGFYKTGALIFYDVDMLYIINSNGQLTAKREGEWPETSIYVTTLDYSIPGNGMFRKEQPINYVSVSEMDCNPHNLSESKNEELGSEAKIVVSDDINVNIAAANQSVIDQRNESIMYSKKDDNKYLPYIVIARMEENKGQMYITSHNVDITAFTPNKIYNMIYDDTIKQENYGNDKTYRLSYAYHLFQIESGEFMSSTHRIVLKQRVSEESLED